MSTTQETICWIVGLFATVVAFSFSHTFYVVPRTYLFGGILLIIGIFLFWLRFRRTIRPRPKWLLLMSNFILVIFCGISLLYLGGVITWFE